MKLALLDEDNNVVARTYLRNQGLKDTILRGLEDIRGQAPDIAVSGVGVTGSGRQFANLLLGADLVKTEILAHAHATKTIFPDVRTIIDIGGEDSKLILLNEQGIWTNYVMNQICAAGTGSMLVNIANNLDVRMEDIGDFALRSRQRLNFPAKCGILCNSAVINYKNRGVGKEDILMGVCRALAKNYMLLARNVNLAPPFVFQGATAKNKALVRALEEELMAEIHVPQYPELMGAIGMAILCREGGIEREFSYALSDEFETRNIIAAGCPNNCEITILYRNGEKIGSIGNRCDRCAG